MKKRFILVLILILASAFFTLSYAEVVPNYDDYTKCTIYVNNQRISQPATSINGNIYVDIDTLQSIGQVENWDFDISAMYIFVDISDLDIFIADEETSAFIKQNAGVVEFPLKSFKTSYDKTIRYYVSIGSVAELARLSWYYEDGCLYLTQYSALGSKLALSNSNIDSQAELATGGDQKVLYKNQAVTILSETTSFYKIRTGSNEVCYVNKDDISLIESEEEIPDYVGQYREKDVYDSPINAMWSKLKHAPDSIDGLDVFVNLCINSYAKSDGSCKQTIDYGFIQSAQATGTKVWLCAQNGFSTTASDYINKNLANESARNKTIAQYLFYCSVYHADGISLDYESMSYTNGTSKEGFLAFVETLNYYAQKMGLTTSVATYYGNSYNDSKMYDFSFLGEHSDFILQMTYGENFAYSLSNMSKSYWQKGMDYIATQTNPEKILLGVAYHMRYTVWNEAGEMIKSSKPKVKDCLSDIAKYNIPYAWDEYTGQYYAEEIYYENGVAVGIGRYYLEEERSAALKAQYIVDKHYGGTIGWEYSYTDNDKVYEAYASIYQYGASYQDWVPEVEPVGPEIPKHDASGKVIINAKAINVDIEEDGNIDEDYGE